MKGYEVKIDKTYAPIDVYTRIRMKDTSSMKSLDELTQKEEIDLTLKNVCILKVHNEKSQDKDYTKYVIVDSNDEMYTTGSQSFFSALDQIIESFVDEDVEPFNGEWALRVYRVPSKNYSGKEFISCTVRKI